VREIKNCNRIVVATVFYGLRRGGGLQ